MTWMPGWPFAWRLPSFMNGHPRSEEHTSELQSLRHLVCRLLLEKKKSCSMKNGKYEEMITRHKKTVGLTTLRMATRLGGSAHATSRHVTELVRLRSLTPTSQLKS